MPSCMGSELQIRYQLKDAVSHTVGFQEHRMEELKGAALQYLLLGHRVSFMELFSGSLFVGVRTRGLRPCMPLGWGEIYPLAGETSVDAAWSLAKPSRRASIRDAIATIDQVILHIAPPEPFLREVDGRKEKQRKEGILDIFKFLLELAEDQRERGGGTSIEMRSSTSA